MLGSKNRDYKTGNRAVTRRIQAHIKRMNELVAGGMDRDAASKKAFDEICFGILKVNLKP
jgi:hypothetical protein